MKCKSKIGRIWEMNLRKKIFWGDEMGDDRPIADFFDILYTAGPDSWGIEAQYHHGETKEKTHQSADPIPGILQ